MVGWSRRNTESTERREAWWATLTEKQKALESRRSKVEDRLFGYVFGVTIFALMTLTAVFRSVPDHQWLNQHPEIFIPCFLAAFPGIAIVGSFIAIHKVKQVK